MDSPNSNNNIIIPVNTLFCPSYFVLIFLLDLGPICVKVRVWTSNLFRYVFYRVFQSFRIRYYFVLIFILYLIVICVKYCSCLNYLLCFKVLFRVILNFVLFNYRLVFIFIVFLSNNIVILFSLYFCRFDWALAQAQAQLGSQEK